MIRLLSLTFLMCFAVLHHANASPQDSDSLATDSSATNGSLNITIDEKGIRVEGGDGTSKRTVKSSNGRHRETGTDIVKFGDDVFIGEGDLVRGDVVVFGGDVTVEGEVHGNVVVMIGDAEILGTAEVKGDVVVLGGTLEEDANVVILGERVMFRDFPTGGFSNVLGPQSRFFAFFFVPVQFFVSIVLSFLIILFLKERVIRTQEYIVSGVLKSFGAGFLVVFVGCVVVSVLALVLLITIIGIPLAFILVISCVAVFIVSRTAFVYALGVKVNEKIRLQTQSPFALVMVGTAVLYLPALLGYGLSLLPVGGPMGLALKGFGWLFSMFGFLVGLGALFLSRFGNRGLTTHTPPEQLAGD